MKPNPYIVPQNFFVTNKDEILFQIRKRRKFRLKLYIAIATITTAAAIALFFLLQYDTLLFINDTINFADTTPTSNIYEDDIFLRLL